METEQDKFKKNQQWLRVSAREKNTLNTYMICPFKLVDNLK